MVSYGFLLACLLDILVASLGSDKMEGCDIFTLWISNHLTEETGVLNALEDEVSEIKGRGFQSAKGWTVGDLSDYFANESAAQAEFISDMTRSVIEHHDGNAKILTAGKQ